MGPCRVCSSASSSMLDLPGAAGLLSFPSPQLITTVPYRSGTGKSFHVRGSRVFTSEEEHDRRKYFSTTEAVGRGNVKRMRHDDYERTRIDKSSLSKEQDSGPSYCYRAPYDGSGETQENVGQENDSVTDIQKTESFLQTTRI